MWGVGSGRWNYQHYFQPHNDMRIKQWTALCGVWMRYDPQPAPDKPQCPSCKRLLERK